MGLSVGHSVGLSVGVSVHVPADVSVGLSADVSVDKFVDKSVRVAVGLSTGVAVRLSVVPRLAVVCRGGLPWLAVEIAVASAMGLHGVLLLAAAFRGSPWNARGSPWSVRGCPWNDVEIAVECRGGPWALQRCSAKKTNNVHPRSVKQTQRRQHTRTTVTSRLDLTTMVMSHPARLLRRCPCSIYKA